MKWKEYQIEDIRNLLKTLPEDEQSDYKLKKLFKNNKLTDDVLMFSKKDFKKYKESHDAYIDGQIKKQRKYKTNEKEKKNEFRYPVDNSDELIKYKQKKNYTGFAKLSLPSFKENTSEKDIYKIADSYENDLYKKIYDVSDTKHRSHIIGYVYVGDGHFLQVVDTNPVLLLVPLLIIIGIIFIIHSCSNGTLPFLPSNGSSMTDENGEAVATESLPNCSYLLFDETVTLTKDHPYIKLCNLKENKDLWYVSYEVYIDGKPLMDLNEPTKVYSTGAIKPGYQIDGKTDKNLNLYDRLDAGTYKLVAKATQYKYQANSKGQHLKTAVGQNITTTLVIKK